MDPLTLILLAVWAIPLALAILPKTLRNNAIVAAIGRIVAQAHALALRPSVVDDAEAAAALETLRSKFG